MSDIGALVAHGLECSQILKSRRLNIIQTKADLLKKSEEMRKEATKQQENLIKSKQVRYQHKILSFKWNVSIMLLNRYWSLSSGSGLVIYRALH